MPIEYGDIQIPDRIKPRLYENLEIDGSGEGHWFWLGAMSGKREIPQIGCTIQMANGHKKAKVFSAAKVLYAVEKGVCPYQIRREKRLCRHKSCVNPDHFYMIPEKPEPRGSGNRRTRVKRIRL